MDSDFNDSMKALRLHYLSQHYADFIRARQNKPVEQIIQDLVRLEMTERGQRTLSRRLAEARLGRFKMMSEFDWEWPKQLDRAQLKAILETDFVRTGKNLIFIGPRCLGKTMIAKNLALSSVHRGNSVRFVTASKLVADLQSCGHRLETRLRYYARIELLIIDELGYLSFQSQAADLLFEVISRRYEKAPIILTTNLAFKEWPTIFPGAACVSALLDRLIHHCEILVIGGDSYRQKESLKSKRS